MISAFWHRPRHRSEVKHMCNLSRDVMEKNMEIGIKQGMEKGKVEGILSPIRSLLLSIGRTAEQVMEALQISETDRSHYVALLKNAQRFKKKQPLLGMERRIIHHNHGSLFQRRQKPVGKPELQKPADPATHTHIPDTNMYLYRFHPYRRSFPAVYLCSLPDTPLLFAGPAPGSRSSFSW